MQSIFFFAKGKKKYREQLLPPVKICYKCNDLNTQSVFIYTTSLPRWFWPPHQWYGSASCIALMQAVKG